MDEAQLTGQAAFEKALSILPFVLRGCFSRAHIIISSRPTDWSIEGVRAAVEKHLVKPIATALSASQDTPVSEIGSGVTLLMAERLPTENIIEPFVVSLDPLSISEAMRQADAFEVDNADAFWTSVSDGDAVKIVLIRYLARLES